MLEPDSLIKKETPAQLFTSEFCEIFKNTYIVVHLQTAASAFRKISEVLQFFFFLCKAKKPIY